MLAEVLQTASPTHLVQMQSMHPKRNLPLDTSWAAFPQRPPFRQVLLPAVDALPSSASLASPDRQSAGTAVSACGHQSSHTCVPGPSAKCDPLVNAFALSWRCCCARQGVLTASVGVSRWQQSSAEEPVASGHSCTQLAGLYTLLPGRAALRRQPTRVVGQRGVCGCRDSFSAAATICSPMVAPQHPGLASAMEWSRWHMTEAVSCWAQLTLTTQVHAEFAL